MASSHRSSAISVSRHHGRQLRISHSSIADKVLLEPWFLPKRVAFAIHSVVPPAFWNKMRYFFEDYGCMICKQQSKHHSNGMCRLCRERIRKKLTQSIKRRSRDRSKQRLDIVLFRQEKLAKRLLGNLRLLEHPHQPGISTYKAVIIRFMRHCVRVGNSLTSGPIRSKTARPLCSLAQNPNCHATRKLLILRNAN